MDNRNSEDNKINYMLRRIYEMITLGIPLNEENLLFYKIDKDDIKELLSKSLIVYSPFLKPYKKYVPYNSSPIASLILLYNPSSPVANLKYISCASTGFEHAEVSHSRILSETG